MTTRSGRALSSLAHHHPLLDDSVSAFSLLSFDLWPATVCSRSSRWPYSSTRPPAPVWWWWSYDEAPCQRLSVLGQRGNMTSREWREQLSRLRRWNEQYNSRKAPLNIASFDLISGTLVLTKSGTDRRERAFLRRGVQLGGTLLPTLIADAGWLIYRIYAATRASQSPSRRRLKLRSLLRAASGISDAPYALAR